MSGIERPPRPTDDKRKFACLFCDKELSLDYYRREATADEIFFLLSEWKLCTRHAHMIDNDLAAREKALIERAVA